MTKYIVSLIFAIIFIVAAFSRPLIPCEVEDKIKFCELGEGEQQYYSFTSEQWVAGGISFVIVFLMVLLILSLIFRRKRVIM